MHRNPPSNHNGEYCEALTAEGEWETRLLQELRAGDPSGDRRAAAPPAPDAAPILLSGVGMDGPISPEQRQRSIAKQWNLPFVDLRGWSYDEDAIRCVSPFLLKQHTVIPLARDGDTLTLAISNPLNVRAGDEIRIYTGLTVKPVVAVEGEILKALDRWLGFRSKEVESLVGSASTDAVSQARSESRRQHRNRAVVAQADGDDASQSLDFDENEPAIVRLVNLILAGGIGCGASDIHVQPEHDRVRVRYRVDGVLSDAPDHSWQYGRAMIARLKVMARVDIAEKRRPQDGRISFSANGKQYDLRVSTFPTIYGEKVVMRLSERDSRSLGLADLGLAADQLEDFRDVIHQPYGMILVTGPTGSGKTTTLYSVLSRLNRPTKNIVTVEDPVERRLAGISQAQVGSTKKSPVTFASAMRHVLRQDPDICMVGEIRDHDTALVATEAALTGHLVLSTLHTNDAPGAPPRLLDMGVEPFLVSSALSAVLAQRLVPVLCSRCKEAVEVPVDALPLSNLPWSGAGDTVTLYKPHGCPECNGRGYAGRIGVFELMVVTDDIRRLVIERASASEIAAAARKQGMTTMLEDAVAKAYSGVTTLEEALRVIEST